MMMRWVFFGLLLASTAQAATLQLDCPRSVPIGAPFTIEVKSDQPLTQVRVEWGGEILDLAALQGASELWLLLGTDVLKSRTGAATLRVSRLGLRPEVVSASISIENQKFPAQHLTVAPEMVTPPAQVLARIARERDVVGAVLSQVSSINHLELPLLRPVPGVVTSAYGLTRFFNNEPRNPHRGLDLRAAKGDPVQATAKGQVVLAEEHYYAGRSVYLDHGQGVHSVYMHLDEILVQPGEMVEPGQVLGRVGMTGRVTGPHLHFGLYVLDLAMDPSTLFVVTGTK